jgi:hypothetical protein
MTGWPWHTTVFAQWDGAATLLDGDASYVNRGLLVLTLRWGRVYARGISRYASSGPWPRRPGGSWLRRSRGRTNCELAEAQPEALFSCIAPNVGSLFQVSLWRTSSMPNRKMAAPPKTR